ncbi:fimbrial usher protein StbD [Klebsiella aerogenes]|uniref:fimbrial usher protein StbD n=1 Tax=Klebsiella aerogenes TaxID=548 RepID=UPI001BCB4185|nr:fimbrial usher protein StbD [Klebsiella aerogenes]
MRSAIHLLLLIAAMATAGISSASCIRVTSSSSLSSAAKAAGYTAASWSGACDTCTSNIGLPSVISVNSGKNFQPAGTLLASAVGNFLTASTNQTYGSNQVLFRCALADAGSLYEMYSTNGDSTYAGKYAVSDVDGAYYDAEKNVAVRITNLSTGEYYSRYWKERQLTSDSWYQDDQYIYIPASAFSNVLYEMYKTDDTAYYVYSSATNKDVWSQPRGYIAFKGPGLATNALSPGEDHNTHYDGWYSLWPGGWSTYNNVTYVRGALCQIKDYPSVVTLPPIAVGALAAGGSSQRPFTVSLECESGAKSSTSASTSSSANVAMGFLVNQPTAVAAAQSLGLVTSGGGLTWLLDTHYGNGGIASGVGIRIYNQSGNAINLLPDRQSTGSGNSRGWYAYQDLTSLISSGSTNIYSGDFTASLEAISGQTITAGTVNAQLQAVVSFQ